MIQSIRIQNFILIDSLYLEFEQGFSAFTGETGAGKSIVMDAISLLCGERTNSSLIRKGAQKALIEAEFTVNTNQEHLLEEAGLDSDCLIVTREFDITGKSTCRINHRPVTLSMLKDLVGAVVDIHSQHDTQYLLNPKYHLSLLDEYASVKQQLQEMKTAFKYYKDCMREYTDVKDTTYSLAQMDILKYQTEEIENANLKEGEEEELEQNIKEMSSYERMYERLQTCTSLLNEENGALPALFDAMGQLDSISDIEFVAKKKEEISSHYYDLLDLYETMKDYLDSMSMDEEQLNQWNERLFFLHKLRRKYNMSVSELLQHAQNCREELTKYEQRDEILDRLEKKLNEAKEKAEKIARKLHETRKKASEELKVKIQKELRDLQLPNAVFETELIQGELKSTGYDEVSFLISMNPGESPKPLHKVASGGELSRLMLGLKTIFTELQGIELVIFDEIDSGVSGSVAVSIGQKMAEISETAQVFAVTHLASVAAWANNHYQVSKQQDTDTTTTSIRCLEESQRIEEMALIASGKVTESSLSAAKELYDSVNRK